MGLALPADTVAANLTARHQVTTNRHDRPRGRVGHDTNARIWIANKVTVVAGGDAVVKGSSSAYFLAARLDSKSTCLTI